MTTVTLFCSGSCLASFRVTFLCLAVSICILTLLLLQSEHHWHYVDMLIWATVQAKFRLWSKTEVYTEPILSLSLV